MHSDYLLYLVRLSCPHHGGCGGCTIRYRVHQEGAVCANPPTQPAGSEGVAPHTCAQFSRCTSLLKSSQRRTCTLHHPHHVFTKRPYINELPSLYNELFSGAYTHCQSDIHRHYCNVNKSKIPYTCLEQFP